MDKQALKELVGEFVDQFAKAATNSGSNIQQTDINTAKQITGLLIDKIQIQQFETWIGLSDARLYQVHFVTNWPSVISSIQNAESLQSTAVSNTSDSKRIADIRLMGSLLELSYNDNGGYPEAKNGQPVGLVPTYTSSIPTAPTATGNCADYYNTYWYTPMGTKTIVKGKPVYSSYQITFCLGADTDGYKAGVAKLSPQGLTNIACPGTTDQCVKSAAVADQNSQIKQKASDYVNKLEFSGQLSVDFNYSGYNVKQAVTAPSNSFDIIQKITGLQASSDDAKRLADIRQLASALELYFNDKNSYPNSLNLLTPTYIVAVPTAPSSIGSACTQQNNTYSYTKISAMKYSLTFCLGQSIGGYQAGTHALTEAGIQ